MLKSMNFLSGKSRGIVSGGKYDVSDWCLGRMLSAFCMLFKYPSPVNKSATYPARDEVFLYIKITSQQQSKEVIFIYQTQSLTD